MVVYKIFRMVGIRILEVFLYQLKLTLKVEEDTLIKEILFIFK